MPQLDQRIAHDERGLEHGGERCSLGRVEIEVEVVGAVGVVASGVPLVEVDAAEIHDPEKRAEILHHREGDEVARVVHDLAGLDPLGRGSAARAS